MVADGHRPASQPRIGREHFEVDAAWFALIDRGRYQGWTRGEVLNENAQAGVPIDLIVRGMCVLRPGVPGVSETIRVRSIVGRFLEHSRVFAFTNGGQREIFVGSADWMGRNLDRRVETVVPVLDPAIGDSIERDILDLLFADNVKARILQADGTYYRRELEAGETAVDAQLSLLRHRQVARG